MDHTSTSSRRSRQPGPNAATARRRPKDRKDQILARAADLFVERGFHSVTMEEIAAEAGITARALYRHHPSKQALLTAAIVGSQQRYLEARSPSADHSPAPRRPLIEELSELIDAALATRELTVLWQREARYLDDVDRKQVRHRLNMIVGGIETSLRLDRPSLTSDQLALRAWAVSSTLTSLGFHLHDLPGRALPGLLHDACLAAAGTPVDVIRMTEGTRRSTILIPSTARREMLLAAGADLFRRYGYPAVSITDIGRTADIAGSGIYRTFPSKQAILDTLTRRLEEWRTLEHLRAMRSALPPVDRLRRLIEGHITVSLDDPDLVGVTLTELQHASAEVLTAIRAGRAGRETHWAELIQQITPATSAAEARILVLAATAYIDDVARTPRLVQGSGVAHELTNIALAILTSRRPNGRHRGPDR